MYPHEGTNRGYKFVPSRGYKSRGTNLYPHEGTNRGYKSILLSGLLNGGPTQNLGVDDGPTIDDGNYLFNMRRQMPGDRRGIEHVAPNLELNADGRSRLTIDTY